jgi:hypothetical protein
VVAYEINEAEADGGVDEILDRSFYELFHGIKSDLP